MRFVHTADWQIGIRAVGLGEAGARRVREERFAAAQRVVGAAKKHAADAIIIAGDVFESNAIDRRDVQRTADILASFNGPVFLLPGNHDPLGPGSVWTHPAWEASKYLHVFRDRTPVLGGGAWLYPCPHCVGDTEIVPLQDVRPESTGFPRIGIVHGSVGMAALDLQGHSIPADAWSETGLDYIALGHWHSCNLFVDPGGATRMAYPGTPEPTATGERDSGQVLIVELAGAGSPPVVRHEKTSRLQWMEITSELRTQADIKHVLDEVNQIQNAEQTVIRVTLSGLLTGDGQPTLDHMRDILETRFLSARLEIRGLRPLIDEDWLAVLPPGVIRSVGEGLRARAETDVIVARALLELRALVSEEAS